MDVAGLNTRESDKAPAHSSPKIVQDKEGRLPPSPLAVGEVKRAKHRIPKSAAVRGQLDRARTSIVLNIPEGNGRFTTADRCRFFDIARGSSLECAGCLDMLFIKHLLSETEVDQGKSLLKDIVSLLVGLIRSNSPERLHEEAVEYRGGRGRD